MFFDGNHKPKKKVNLSSTKKETAEDLYKRIKKERAVRRQHQEENRAALTVQTLFRRRRDVTHARREVTAEFDATLKEVPQGSVLALSKMRLLLAQYNFLESGNEDFDDQRGVRMAILVAASIKAGRSGSESLQKISGSPAATKPLDECVCSGVDDGMFDFYQVARLCSVLLGVLSSKNLFNERFMPLAKLILWVVESFTDPKIVGSEVLAANFCAALLNKVSKKLFTCILCKYADNSVRTSVWPIVHSVAGIVQKLEGSKDSLDLFTFPYIFYFALKFDVNNNNFK